MMKLLPEGYCIDTTEVTREQYQTWLASGATAKPTSQISDCAWNDSYLPSTDAHNDWPPVINIKAPVALIDWCDAYAYCIGVGKRLCGKIGGGPSSPNELSSQPNTNQWVNACSSHGVNDYATGDSYVIGTCNSNNADGGSNFVANMPDCQSPVTAYSGVYDLSGNVQEFIDTCDATSGMAAQCETSGGSFWFWDSQMMCTSSYLVRRDFKAAWIGFRCCSP
jgi:formylglycine-generating enzyme required for sulfatase activity